MQSLEKLKRISHLTRMLLFTLVGGVLGIAIYGFVTQGQWWVTLGDKQFDVLWHQHEGAKSALGLVFAPLLATWLLGFYFLQRLLLVLSRGLFYAKATMRYLTYLSWITFFHVFYKMIMTPLATYLITSSDAIDISLNPMTLIVVLCLPVLVHLFSTAADLDKENKEIV